jgi:two-component sensor histidine kinase
LLAVVQSIVRMTKGHDVKTFQQEVGGRIQALAQAHNLLAESRWSAADLQRIATEELAPYMGEDVRAWLSGTVMLLRPTAAQAIALMLHELVTNAAKYGALSVPEGRVKLDWRFDKEGHVLIRWREEGGPTPDLSPGRTGVGTTMIRHAANQVEGIVTYDWRPTGLSWQLRAPAAGVITAEAPH